MIEFKTLCILGKISYNKKKDDFKKSSLINKKMWRKTPQLRKLDLDKIRKRNHRIDSIMQELENINFELNKMKRFKKENISE